MIWVLKKPPKIQIQFKSIFFLFVSPILLCSNFLGFSSSFFKYNRLKSNKLACEMKVHFHTILKAILFQGQYQENKKFELKSTTNWHVNTNSDFLINNSQPKCATYAADFPFFDHRLIWRPSRRSQTTICHRTRAPHAMEAALARCGMGRMAALWETVSNGNNSKEQAARPTQSQRKREMGN